MNFSNNTKERLVNDYGSWALVTGASSGIGEALAERLAECGFNLVLTARNELKLNQLATQFQQNYKIKVEVEALDLSHEKNIGQIIEYTEHLNIGLVILAAGFGTSGLFIVSDIKDEQNMLDLNCATLLSLTHHFVQKFANKGRGGIILMSSIVGFQGAPFAANYAATKAYVQSLAEGLYHELKPINVDVLAASPGPVNSGFANRAHMKMSNTLDPTEIAIPILKALGRQSTVFPGNLTKLLIFGLRTVPRWGKIRIMKLVMGGMTKHQLKTKK